MRCEGVATSVDQLHVAFIAQYYENVNRLGKRDAKVHMSEQRFTFW